MPAHNNARVCTRSRHPPHAPILVRRNDTMPIRRRPRIGQVQMGQFSSPRISPPWRPISHRSRLFLSATWPLSPAILLRILLHSTTGDPLISDMRSMSLSILILVVMRRSEGRDCVPRPQCREYLIKCVTGGFHYWLSPSGQRSAKVMANAFKAGFHLVTHRTWPLPVGSSERTVR